MDAPLLRSFVELSLGSEGLNMRLLPVVLGAVVLAWEYVRKTMNESELAKLESVTASLLSEA